MSNNLIARILVAVVTIPIILWVCYRGGDWLFGMVTLFATIALGEILFNEGCKPNQILFWLAYVILGGIFITQYNISGAWTIYLKILFSGINGLLLFFLLSAMILATGKLSPKELFQKNSRLFWGLFYVAMLYPFVYKVGTSYNFTDSYSIQGGDWLLFLFGVLWIGDTAAMFVGKAVGKRKLAPGVSPNKTVEGFIGGLLGAVIIGIVMYYWKFDQLDWYHPVIIALGCSLFGQLGDLVESMWKRSLAIKDSSAIIPGHGGMLDRFDSLLFAAPFMFYYKLFILY